MARRVAAGGAGRGLTKQFPMSRSRAAKPASKRRATWRYRIALAGVLLAVLGAGYVFWLRDSSLVAVTDVEVVGVTSGDTETIIGEITRASKSMTTLNVQTQEIERTASQFPTIASVSVDANFPHGLRIEVDERPPALLVSAGEREVPVAGDGTLLTGVAVDQEELPVLAVEEIPSGGLLDGEPLQQALVIGATPAELHPLIEEIEMSKDFGIEIVLRGGVPVRFGTATRAAEKWDAAAAVLADPSLDALTYLDVRVPERPAAGGAAQAVEYVEPPL